MKEKRLAKESVFALGIVRGQVDERALLCEGYDFVRGLVGDEFAGAYSVYLSCEKKLLVVAGVAREEK
jgi:hypothetical protein